MGQDEWYETRGCSRARKGQGARARIKARRGGEPLVFAALAAVDDKGIQLVGGKAYGIKARRPDITRAHPWASPVDAQPLKIA